MSRVLIAGAGLTGSLCACLLRREMQSKVHIEVWDKARAAGLTVCRSDCLQVSSSLWTLWLKD